MIPALYSFRRLKATSRTGVMVLSCVVFFFFFSLDRASARIVRVVIQRTELAAFDGASFGKIGHYEKLVGVAYGEVDPNDAHNRIIQDIALAPRNSRGMVEYSMDIYILRPISAQQGNSVLFYDVVNRGNKGALPRYNVNAPGSNEPANTVAAAGDGFLMSHGYTLVWSGWQADQLPGNNRMTITVPTLTVTPSGDLITAMVHMELMVAAPTKTLNLSSGWFPGLTTASYPTTSFDTTKATLTQRVREEDSPVPIASSDWAFADCSTTAFPGVPSATQICLKNGFDPNYIYDLKYQACEPKVLGLGFASTRDFISYLRHTKEGEELVGLRSGTSGPLGAIMYGASQSGRYVRSFLDLGFNADEQGRIVFDGMIPHLATGRLPLNVRWGQPSRASGQHEDHSYPASEEPLTWGNESNPIQGVKSKSGSLLDRCNESRTCPKIMQVVTQTEYWQWRMSLGTTDPLGKKDLPVPDNVRIYFLSSTEHAGAAVSSKGICQQFSNPAPYRETLRALLVALTDWILHDKTPPASRYAMLKDGTLGKPEDTGFPSIPGVSYTGLINYFQELNFGNDFRPREESGIVAPGKKVPGANYVVLAPKVDKDGNDIAGVRSSTIQAPLGTYTGWNLRKAGFAEGELCSNTGSYIPFAVHKADRMASGDPRLSLEERYGNHAGYVAAVTAAANQLVGQGYLLPEDAQRLIAEAQASNVLQ
jgi:hypothetical protein